MEYLIKHSHITILLNTYKHEISTQVFLISRFATSGQTGQIAPASTMLFPDHYQESTFNYSFSNYTPLWIRKGDTEVAWKATLMVLIVSVALVSNSVIVYLIIRFKMFEKCYYVFVANMSVASILLNIYSPWTFLMDHIYQSYPLGELACHLSSFSLVMFMLVNGLSIVVLSCDRLAKILFPLNKVVIKLPAAITIIVVIWICSICLCAPLFAWKDFAKYHYKDVLSVSCVNSIQVKSHQYYLFLIVFLVYIPIIINAITYVAILIKIQMYKKVIQTEHEQIISRRNKLMKMFFIIMMIYAWSGLPFNILLLYQNRSIKGRGYKLPPYVTRFLVYFTHLLIYGHHAINPFIYGLSNENMKRAFWTSFPFLRRNKNRIYPYFVKRPAIRIGLQHRLSAPPVIENFAKNKRVKIKIPDSDTRPESLGHL